MNRNRQIVLNLLIVVTLLVSALGILPVQAVVFEEDSDSAAAAAQDIAEPPATAIRREKPLDFKSAQDVQASRLMNLKAVTVQPDDATAWGDQEVIIIVRLSDLDVVNYAGGTAGLAPTAPTVTGAVHFNAHTLASEAYLNYLAKRQTAFVASVQQFSKSAKAVARYQAALNGVALRLPAKDVVKVRAVPGVSAIYKAEIQHVDTDRGPQWIGAPSIWTALGGQNVAGKDIVIGVIDTGGWSPNPLKLTLQYTMTHPSFASNASVFGGAYTFPFTSVTGIGYSKKLGVCGLSAPQPSDGTFVCNDKLIGGYWYNAAGIATATEFKSPLDNGGHGTHTASIAAGNRAIATVSRAPIVSGVAPRARLVVYKVCWEGDPDNSSDGGCSNVDSLSAIDQAILDGVNVINFSISGGTSPTHDPVELAFLNARAAGIFVSASAGNSGPAAGTVNHLGPWVNTSAAMMHDRTVLANVIVTSTFGTPPTNLRGASATGGMTGRAVLAPPQFAGDTYPGQCTQPYAPGTFQSSDVVVCRRGINARIEKSRNVKLGGAGGFILINASNNQGLSLDAYWVPAVHLEKNAASFSTPGEALVTYLLTAVPTHVVTITLSAGYLYTRTGDVMAAFSSRGPSSMNQIKPDNAAPGVEVLAGVTPQNSENWTPDGDLYEYYDGTSMSSPHTAGAGALLKALHPAWTASEIQAALMTGAVPILKEDAITPATPFDQGAGRINLAHAMAPGLLFDVPLTDYQAFVNGNKRIETLNIPSLAQSQCPLLCSWTRRATNALTTTATFTWTVVTATPGFTVTLDQASYTLGPGAARTFTVTADVSALPYNSQYVFARVILHETATGIEVDLPVAVVKAGTTFEAEVNITTPRDSGGKTFGGGVGNNYSGVTTTVYGLADPIVTAGGAAGNDDHNPTTNPLDPAHGWFVYTDTLPAQLGRYVVTTGNSTASDLDLYLLYDRAGNGYDFADGDPANPASDVIARSLSGAAAERIDLLDLQNDAGKQFLIAVYNRSGEANATFDLTRWLITPTMGGLQVSGVPPTLHAGDTITPLLKYHEAMLPGDAYYGLVSIGLPGNEAAVTQVLVNVNRTASEVTKVVTPTVVKVGDVVTYTIVIDNKDTLTRTFTLTDVLPTGMSYVPNSLTGPATYNFGLNAILISTTIPGLTPGPNYVIDNSLTNPGLVQQSPLGGFHDLSQYGAPVARFDNVLYSYGDVGCPFSFYDSANATPNGFQFATNGLVGPRSGIAGGFPGPTPSPIPTAADPNGFIAVNWGNVSIANTLGFTNSGSLGFQLYFNSLACPTDFLWAFEFHRLHSKTDATKVLDVQYLYDFADPDVHWVLYGPVSGSWGAAAGEVVGAENFSGTLGVAYTGPITTGLVLRYRRELVSAPPITVTFQARVIPNTLSVLTNTAQYTVDVPGTEVMDVIAEVEHLLSKMYLPVISQ